MDAIEKTGFSGFVEQLTTSTTASGTSTGNLSAVTDHAASEPDNNNNNCNNTIENNLLTNGTSNAARETEIVSGHEGIVDGTSELTVDQSDVESNEHQIVLLTPVDPNPSPLDTGPDSKNKELSSEDFGGHSNSGGQVVVHHQSDRMSEIPESEEGWRAYYDHPLTAATTAMLNINAPALVNQAHHHDPDQGGGPGVGLLYELYKLPPMEKGMEKALADKIYGPLPEIWSAAVATPNGVQVITSSGLTDRNSPSSLVGISKAVIVPSVEQQHLVGGSAGSTVSRNESPSPGESVNEVLSPADVDLYLNRAAQAAAKREANNNNNINNNANVGSNQGSPQCIVIVNGSSPDSPELQHQHQHHQHLVSSIGSAVIISPGGQATDSELTPVLSPEDGHRSVLGQSVVIIKQETSSPIHGSRLSSPSPHSVLTATPPSTSSDSQIKSESSILVGSSPCHTPVDLVSATAPLAPSAVAVTGSPISGPLGSPDSCKSNDMNGAGGGAASVISLSAAATQPFPSQVFGNIASQATYETLGMAQYGVLTNAAVSAPPQYGTQTTSSSRTVPSSVYTLTQSDYYRDYYSPSSTPNDQYQTVRQHLATYGEGADIVDRYIRQNGTAYKTNLHGLSVDLPSPDSGIGEATITPRDSAGLSQIFDYSELSQTQTILQAADQQSAPSASRTPNSQGARRSWHEFGRNSESDKVQIPKLHCEFGFKYFLESPISTSQRREDDRITYINKGQFYGITLEYSPDPERSLKSPTVKSVVMLVFREEKSTEEETKAWQFWHSRQHSVKQRILDADTKNSSGIIGQIEEITHNAIAFYWNPLESQAKINIAVQCLSTDFSNQKGVKGLPLHLQVDTFDDYREGSTPVHRGYCQIKVFCDKGAERKTRDEERRAAKRKLTATGSDTGGRKKIEEMYHPPIDRSEFYSMSDLQKPPVLFTPSEDIDKKEISTISQQMAGMELSFYSQASTTPTPVEENGTPTILERREKIEPCANSSDLSYPQPPTKRLKTYPSDRVLLYAKRDTEDVFHALHLVPPTLAGLANAIQNKYEIGANSIRSIYKRCSKGITVEMDDDIVKHYCNEDTFLIEIIKTEDDFFDVTLVEL